MKLRPLVHGTPLTTCQHIALAGSRPVLARHLSRPFVDRALTQMLRSSEYELPALSLGIPAEALSCLKTRPASCQSHRSTSCYDSGPAHFAETTHYHRRTTSDLSQAEVSDMDFHFSVPRSTGSRQFSSPNGSAMIRPLPLHPYSLSRSSSALSEPPVKPDTYSPKKRLRRNTNG